MTKLRWTNPPSESDPARRQPMADGNPAEWIEERQAARNEHLAAQTYDEAKEEHARLARLLKACLRTERRRNEGASGARESEAARAKRARKIEQTTVRLAELDAILTAAKATLAKGFE